MADDRISNVEELEASIGKMPPTMNLKVINHLDEGALQWISACSLAFMGFGSSSGPHPTTAGGEPGFIDAGRDSIEIPIATLDDPEGAISGVGFGSLFLLPQTGEMMRINGRVAERTEETIVVSVIECYIHCAKALIRSNFWSPEKVEPIADSPYKAVNSARFLALVTMNKDGEVDVSPKGDPSGLLARVEEDHIWIAERPGNRRADSFKNILKQPRMAAVLLHPGSTALQVVRGEAELSTNSIREEFAVDDRVPTVATRITVSSIVTLESNALERSSIWKREMPGIKPADILSKHLKLSKELGFAGRVLTSVPGIMRRGLDADYKKNLY